MRKLIFAGSLVVIDQIIKIINSLYFVDNRMVLGNLLGFSPYLNTNQLSIFNNELSMNLSSTILIILNVLIIFLVVVFYLYFKKQSKQENIRYLNIMFIFLISGTSCSLIDKIFWGGSLDYIRILSQIADLKDIYLLLGAVFYFIWALKLKSKNTIEREN